MKFALLSPATLASAFLLSSTLLGVDGSLRGGSDGDAGTTHRVLQDSMSGLFLRAELEYKDGSTADAGRRLRKLNNGKGNGKGNGNGNAGPRQTINVQLDDGQIYELKNVGQGWLNGKGKGKKSGVDAIKIPPGAVISGATIDLKGAEPEDTMEAATGKNLFDRRRLATTEQQARNLAALGKRRLQIDNKTVLVVRVVADDAFTTSSEDQLRDSVLGTAGDPVNLASQYDACSFGQLTFAGKANMSMTTNPNDGASTDITNGAVTVKIAGNVAGQGDDTIRNLVTAKLADNFGTAQLADHVMLCLPPGTAGGWIAYAYINWYLGVYNDEWCTYVSGQMHEIGHNLGYAHSGEGGGAYDDQSGMMGYSYSSDDSPAMCFNAAKSWQTGWYQSKHATVEANGCLETDLYGIVDYDKPAADTVLIKINDPSDTDHYIAFNRAREFNSGTLEAADQVTVVQAGGEGTGYAPSTLLAKMNAGDSYTGIANVVVNVVSIDLAANKARVIVSSDGNGCNVPPPTPPPTVPVTPPPSPLPTNPPTTAQPTNPPTTAQPTTPSPTTAQPTPNPTSNPTTPSPTTANPTPPPTTAQPTPNPTPIPTTPQPTPCPGMEITVDILTDNYPAETSYTLTNNCDASVIEGPGYAMTASTQYSDTYCLPSAEYTFTLSDSWGDGICCGYGSGNYAVYSDGTQVASGGQFGSSESTTFGSCGGGPSPTPPPTVAVTPLPTLPPTPPPTAAVTPPPAPPSGGPVVAAFDAGLGVPKCASVGSSCTTGQLVNGAKSNIEPNPSNTLDTCTDGPYGSYHSDESVDQITITSVDGGPLAAGTTARIEAQVWAWGDGSYDAADFYHASTVGASPTWNFIGSIVPGNGGASTLAVLYTLPATSALQAVRVQFRYQGARGGGCAAGSTSWYDVDDLAFAVAPASSGAVVAEGAKKKPAKVAPPKPLPSSHCAAIGAKERKRCEAVPVCEWRNGQNKGCYPQA